MLRHRNKPKDAYDVVWLLEGWPQLNAAFVTLDDQFRKIDRAGAWAYARFLRTADEETDLLARRAAGAVSEFLQVVRDA